MRAFRGVLLAMVLLAGAAEGQTGGRQPRIGYVYPAGGRAGTSFEVLVGGQALQTVTDVYVSGEGVQARINAYYPADRRFGPGQRQALGRRVQALIAQRMTDLGMPPDSLPSLGTPPDAAPAPADPNAKLPDSPFLRNLDTMSLRQLVNVLDRFFPVRRRGRGQLVLSQSELLLLQVTIDPGAAPGNRRLSLATPGGISNGLCFQIGVLPEAREQEPNDPDAYPSLPPEPPLELPAVLNGQITPGDVDRVSFRATAGQHLVFEAVARGLLPFRGDDAPAPFRVALALYSPLGRQVDFDDADLDGPDPACLYNVPKDGVYQLEVRDALPGGGRDFVYRIAIGELPYVTSAFPLGGLAGGRTVATIRGWNLPGHELPLDTSPGDDVRRAVLTAHGVDSNPVTYAVGTLPEGTESEPNDGVASAEKVTLPVVVNGRIGRPGDADVFRFDGRAGDAVVAAVDARRLGSPLDSGVRVLDSAGHVLGSNDDRMPGDADSCLTVHLPADGACFVEVSDSHGRGGPDYAYRLRISAPQPDFRLAVSPAGLAIPADACLPVTVHVLRTDGFAGPVAVALRDAPHGFSLSGATVPAKLDSVRMTLQAPGQPTGQPVPLVLAGTAAIDGKAATHAATAVDTAGAALFWGQSEPARTLAVAVRRSRQAPPIELSQAGPVRVPAGGSAQVEVKVPLRPAFSRVVLEPMDPPPGVSVDDAQITPDGITFLLKADGKDAAPGLADNLIVDAYAEGDLGDRGRQRRDLGTLPAIAFVVVSP